MVTAAMHALLQRHRRESLVLKSLANAIPTAAVARLNWPDVTLKELIALVLHHVSNARLRKNDIH